MTGGWERRWRAFAAISRPGGSLFPEWLEAGLVLVRPARSRGGLRSLATLARFLVPARRPRLPERLRGGCDTILCYHSVSENSRPAILSLARRLAEQGQRCLVRSYEGSTLHEPAPVHRGGATRAIGLGQALSALEAHPSGVTEALLVGTRSLAATVALLLRIAVSGERELRFLLADPFGVWLALARSALRLRAAHFLVEALGVRRILVTHERFSPGADLLLSRAGSRVATMLYLHAPPVTYEHPVLAKEVFVWNESTRADLVRHFDGRSATPTVHPVGNWELDHVLEHPRRAPVAGGGPALLFLSQCVGADDVTSREATAEALGWIARAATEHPDWTFLLKERHYDDELRSLVTAGPLSTLPNVVLLPASESYARLLACPSVRAVAAYSSSGLFVAAGAGKLALRLMVRHAKRPLSVVDDVVTRVASADELCRALDARPAVDAEAPEAFGPTPPGRALDRIAAHCARA